MKKLYIIFTMNPTPKNEAASSLGRLSVKSRVKKMGKHAFKLHMQNIAKLPRKPKNA